MNYDSDDSNDIYFEGDYNELYINLNDTVQDMKWDMDNYIDSEYIFLCEYMTYKKILNFIDYIEQYY